MSDNHVPPKQSGAGQLVDGLFLVALMLSILIAPHIFGLSLAHRLNKNVSGPSWHEMGQTPAVAQSWEKLGYTPQSAQELIGKHIDYTFNIGMLSIAVLTVAAYFALLLYVSRVEYRDVIAEHFDRQDN
ncbi:hypothetical protein [Hyphomicrobium sp. 99]|uniref:hypothetical protein n=1 Tax=Hyphomicrobium sp. 99 TaxID=1163419 RepID=UPI0005F795A6|nr:hypothetical protein [Hyphomicrobium sp. 99]